MELLPRIRTQRIEKISIPVLIERMIQKSDVVHDIEPIYDKGRRLLNENEYLGVLFDKIKSHLTDYKTLDEIMPIAKVSRGFLIQRLRLLEDKNLLVSAIVGTAYKRGSTKAYKLK